MRTLARTWQRWFFLYLVALSHTVDAKPTDPATDFFIDISDLAGEPCGICIRTKKAYWQLPAEQLRRGYGIGLFSIARNTTNNCEARIYVEVEDIGSLDIEDAVDKAVKDLASVLAPHQTQIEGEVTREREEPYKFGPTSVRGCKLTYAVKVLNAQPVTVDPATALMFRHKGALVTVTVENFSTSEDHFTPILKAISIEKPPPKGGEWRLKLVDATAGIYRYFETPLPSDMLPERSDQLEGNAIGFCRYQDGKPVMRIRISKSEMDRPMEEKEEAEFRHSDLLDTYQLVSALEEMAVGGGKAWLCTGRDGSTAPPRRLAVLYFRPHKLMWTWTMESIDPDDKRFEKDLATFKSIVKMLNYWIARPR